MLIQITVRWDELRKILYEVLPSPGDILDWRWLADVYLNNGVADDSLLNWVATLSKLHYWGDCEFVADFLFSLLISKTFCWQIKSKQTANHFLRLLFCTYNHVIVNLICQYYSIKTH